MARHNEYEDDLDYLGDFEYQDSDGTSFDEIDDVDSFWHDSGWSRASVNVVWWNPLTWIGFLFVSVRNFFAWSWWRLLIHWDRVSNDNRSSIKHLLLEALIAAITIGIGYVLPSGEFRGYIYAVFAVLLIVLIIDALIIILFRGAKIMGVRQY